MFARVHPDVRRAGRALGGGQSTCVGGTGVASRGAAPPAPALALICRSQSCRDHRRCPGRTSWWGLGGRPETPRGRGGSSHGVGGAVHFPLCPRPPILVLLDVCETLRGDVCQEQGRLCCSLEPVVPSPPLLPSSPANAGTGLAPAGFIATGTKEKAPSFWGCCPSLAVPQLPSVELRGQKWAFLHLRRDRVA